MNIKQITCFFILLVVIGLGPAPVTPLSPADTNAPPKQNPYGPTLLLGYDQDQFKENPISSFMYFVPLISPTPVYFYTSTDNTQRVGIVSYRKKVSSKSFVVQCDFAIRGGGFHLTTYDPKAIIAAHTKHVKEGQTIAHMLDYIKLQGGGFARTTVKGRLADGVPTVTEIRIHFESDTRKSPIIVGLYDVKPKQGKYKFENRSNILVARAHTLIFQKSEKDPRMKVKLISVGRTDAPHGIFGRLKGVLANIFMDPVPIEEFGNQTLLNFGLALFEEKPTFTFPLSQNIL